MTVSTTASFEMSDQPRLHFAEKLVVLASWSLAGAIFLTVGWMALAPNDPYGAVSLVSGGGAVWRILEAVALAAVVAAVVTAISGRLLLDVGVFGASIGLGLVAIRGETVEYLLVKLADDASASQRGLALMFAVESIGWLIVVLTAVVVSGLTGRWLFGISLYRGASRHGAHSTPAHIPSGLDVPFVASEALGTIRTAPDVGVKHTLVAAGVCFVLMGLLSYGLDQRAVRHGQVCFVVAASMYIATRLAYRAFPVRSVLWSILAIGLVAVLGYVWAAIRASSAGHLPTVPTSHFLRILPIELVSVGTAASIISFWYTHPTAIEA